MGNQGHWVGEDINPYHYFGFIYLITDKTSGRLYVGKKQLWSARRVMKGCKSKVTDRQSPKWKSCCWKEMPGWRKYKGSSKALDKWQKEYINNEYEYRILYQCRSKGTLHYRELKELWNRNVLTEKMDDGEYLYFNRSIGAIKFRPPAFFSEEVRAKVSKAGLGRSVSEETRGPSDKGVYVFFNQKDSEYFEGTRQEFQKHSGIHRTSIGKLVIGKQKTAGGWRLINGNDL